MAATIIYSIGFTLIYPSIIVVNLAATELMFSRMPRIIHFFYQILSYILYPFFLIPFLYLVLLPLLGLKIPVTRANLLASADTGFGLYVISLFSLLLIYFFTELFIFKKNKGEETSRYIRIITICLFLIALLSPILFNCQVANWLSDQNSVCYFSSITNINPLHSSIRLSLLGAKIRTLSLPWILNSIAYLGVLFLGLEYIFIRIPGYLRKK